MDGTIHGPITRGTREQTMLDSVGEKLPQMRPIHGPVTRGTKEQAALRRIRKTLAAVVYHEEDVRVRSLMETLIEDCEEGLRD